MKIRACVVIYILLFSAFSSEVFGQIRSSRPVGTRSALPKTRVTSYRVIFIRAPLPAPPGYMTRPAWPVSIINTQNNKSFQRRYIQEYPNRYTTTRNINTSYINTQETTLSDSQKENYETKIKSIENRLSSLESIASQIKLKLENSPAGSAVSGDYNQRLVRLEEQMQALRDVLVELRNYLASKK